MMLDLTAFLEKPCRLRLRSGREVYGVLWRGVNALPNKFFFASNGDFSRLRSSKERPERDAHMLDRDDIIAAELMEDLVGVGL